ncbi:hypothetical protein RCH18_000864 [Flavobacterium sp. PL11]|jgi:hypothetical protein|nr:hypothetical protein [Flavobacterium sp. PL11]
MLPGLKRLEALQLQSNVILEYTLIIPIINPSSLQKAVRIALKILSQLLHYRNDFNRYNNDKP